MLYAIVTEIIIVNFSLLKVCLTAACTGLEVPLCGRQFAKNGKALFGGRVLRSPKYNAVCRKVGPSERYKEFSDTTQYASDNSSIAFKFYSLQIHCLQIRSEQFTVKYGNSRAGHKYSVLFSVITNCQFAAQQLNLYLILSKSVKDAGINAGTSSGTAGQGLT